MKPFFVAALAAALALSSGTFAGAATASPWTIKAGIGIQNNAPNSTNPVVAIGADYLLQPATTVSPVALSLYGDLIGKSVGGGIAVRTQGSTYAGIGVGLYNVSISSVPITSSGLGEKVFAGFGSSGAAFELGYHILPPVDGIHSNAFTAEVAFHL